MNFIFKKKKYMIHLLSILSILFYQNVTSIHLKNIIKETEDNNYELISEDIISINKQN